MSNEPGNRRRSFSKSKRKRAIMIQDGQGHEIVTQGKSTFHPIHFFADGQRVSRCVALVHIQSQTGTGSGTGFLLPANWLLTNHHVIPNQAVARAAIVMFNVELGADGLYTSPEQYRLDPDAGFFSSPAHDGDDWALVKIKGDANIKFGAIRLAPATLALGDALHIIQHPAGGHKQIAMFEKSVIEIDARRIRYLTDTLPGSSGSPVFNNQWQVVALHHAGAQSQNQETGALTLCNEGIAIAAILEGLQAAGVWPHRTDADDVRLEINPNRGPMPVDDPWYTHRKADRDALKHFQHHGITVALKGGTGCGKSSLALRLQAALADQGWLGVGIDIRDNFATADFANGHAFLRQLAQRIVKKTHAGEQALKTFDFDGTPSAFMAFLDELTEEAITKPLLLTLDGLDAIAGKPCCSEVLSGLRLVHNAQSQLGARHRVKILLVHTIKPQQSAAMGSVFDVARVVEVADFSKAELADLAALYRLQPINIDQLYDFLGGHPGLSRLALNALIDGNLTLEQLIKDALGDASVFDSHLQRVWHSFFANAQFERLASAFHALIKGGELPDEACFETLLALGVVRGNSRAEARLRCDLYAAYISRRLR